MKVKDTAGLALRRFILKNAREHHKYEYKKNSIYRKINQIFVRRYF
jgi:hypothetical protein